MNCNRCTVTSICGLCDKVAPLLLLNPANIPISINMYLRPRVVLTKCINQGRHKKGEFGMRAPSFHSQRQVLVNGCKWMW